MRANFGVNVALDYTRQAVSSHLMFFRLFFTLQFYIRMSPSASVVQRKNIFAAELQKCDYETSAHLH